MMGPLPELLDLALQTSSRNTATSTATIRKVTRRSREYPIVPVQDVFVCMCVCVHTCKRVHVCMRVCVCACVRTCVSGCG